MAKILITRHAGAVEFCKHKGIRVEMHDTHLNKEIQQALKAGDCVIGTLPINLVADLTARGIKYMHFSLEVPAELRGQELTLQQMIDCNATIEEFAVTRV